VKSQIGSYTLTLLALSLKSKPPITPQPETDRIDLQRFKTSNSPIFNGPFQAIKPSLKWIHGTQIFFATKDVRHSADKIRIAGSLIRETNTLAFYDSSVDTFVVGLWDAFKTALFDFALPPIVAHHPPLQDPRTPFGQIQVLHCIQQLREDPPKHG
jgi:hypothetical protein